jgi:hypothetical protein
MSISKLSANIFTCPNMSLKTSSVFFLSSCNYCFVSLARFTAIFMSVFGFCNNIDRDNPIPNPLFNTNRNIKNFKSNTAFLRHFALPDVSLSTH